MTEDANDSSRPPVGKGAGEMSEAEIDANVEGTFPASDPPAWTLGSDHRPASGRERDEDEDEEAKTG